MLGFNAKAARVKRRNSVTREVVYRNAVKGELLPLLLVKAAESLFDEDDQAAKVNARRTRETVYNDAVTGQPLQWGLVEAARKCELEYFDSKKVWKKRPPGQGIGPHGPSAQNCPLDRHRQVR